MINARIIKSNLNTAKQVIDFFAAEYTNSTEYNSIQAEVLKINEKFNRRNGDTFIKMGFFSELECTIYLTNQGIENTGRVVDETIRALEYKNIIYPVDRSTKYYVDDRYRFNGEFAASLYKQDLILNIILGFEYIIERYKNSVFKIEHINNDDSYNIGTGFLTNFNNKNILITNVHVVESAKKINVYNNLDNPIDVGKAILHPNLDLAILPILSTISYPSFVLNQQTKILSEIITVGYPKVPMTKFAYQIYHKGEINSFIQDYFNNHFFLFSAKTSAGNSGSPVIDEYGTVVGIVSQEFFEQKAFKERGTLPYYAAISTKDIIDFLNTNYG